MRNSSRVYISKINNRFTSSVASISDLTLKRLVEEIVNDCVKYLVEIYQIKPARQKSILYFIEKVKDKSIADLTWSYLCELVHKNSHTAKYCAYVLHYALTNNLYVGEYKEKLLSIMPLFDVNYWGETANDTVFSKHFIGDDIQCYHFISKAGQEYKLTHYYLIKTNNHILWDILREFCDKDDAQFGNSRDAIDFFAHSGSSLGVYEDSIVEISSFSHETYITQVNYYSKFYNAKNLLLALNRMYVHLIEHPSGMGKNIFKETDDMELDVLKRRDFAQRTIDGFKLHYFNPFAPIPSDDKWILHINGFDRGSSKSNPNTTRAYDFTKVKIVAYKELLKEAVWIGLSRSFASRYETFAVLVDTLNYIHEFKSQPDYPNPDCLNLNIFEATIIRKHIENSCDNQGTRSHHLYALKTFLGLQNQNNTMTFDVMFFDYLKNFRVKNENKAKAIPNDDLAKIDAVMRKNNNNSYFNELCYAIFHVCLQTEFRISQICSLKNGCIEPTMKTNQFMVSTVSKTSNGQEYTAVIPALTKAHLEDVSRLSEPVRVECTDPKFKDYLFLFKSLQNRYKYVSDRNFREYFADCCRQANVPIYTPSNLRDTHMTQAEEYRMRHNESDSTLTVLTGHKRVDTSHNRYIENELLKMLESTYGIILGDVDVNGEIVEAIDASFANKEHSVEHGCGYCKNNTCVILSAISCLMCEYFKTTIAHEQKFQEHIKQIDNMISGAPTPHDKDDLMNIKRLFCAYLLAIWKKKKVDIVEQ